jgi:hypothetical protein
MPKSNLYLAVLFILIGFLAIVGLAVAGNSGAGLRGWLDRIERHHQLLLVLVTGLLALTTGLLWWSTRDLVLDARDTAQRQLRAYIGPFGMELTVYPFESGGSAFIAHIEFRNFGKTPAYDLAVSSNAKIDDPNAIPFHEDTEPQQPPSAGIAFPDAGQHVNLGWRLSDEELRGLRDRSKVLFLWGTVRYTDAFGKRHHFLYRMVSQEKTTDAGEVYRIGPHALGYDAD